MDGPTLRQQRDNAFELAPHELAQLAEQRRRRDERIWKKKQAVRARARARRNNRSR